jgi:ATP-binding cassette subfamily B protein
MATLKRLFSYLKPYKFKTVGIILLLLFIMGCNTLMPYLMQVSIDDFVANSNIYGLLGVGLLLSALTLSSMLLSKIRIYGMSKITNSVLIRIRKDLFTHLQDLSFSFFDSRPVGKILSRVVGDVNALQSLLNNSIVNLIPNLFTIAIVIVLMIALDAALALICLTILPVLLIGMFWIETRSNKLWGEFRKARSHFNGYTHEGFSGMRVTQAFHKEAYVLKRFNQNLDAYGDGFLKAIKLQDFFWPLVDLCRGAGICIVLFCGLLLYQKGTLSIGVILAFILYIEMLWRPIMNLSSFYNAFVTNLSAAERIFEILDTPKDVMAENLLSMPPIEGRIEFKDVTFSYGEDSTHALSKVSFTIQKGEKVALVGETGSGKTTITNLISRFYSPNEGKILIDGMDLSQVDPHSLRSQMGIMLQDSFLFSAPIRENIAYGKLDATEKEIIDTAKAVYAHPFISELDKGYDTNVNERGSRLSQGQRQLIAFARALIANPKILILDEATANIDTQTERLVQKGIQTLMKNRTSIVIAHRLSTIRDCDKIFVLSHGKIVEVGTHDELLLQKGYYHNLYNAQYKFLDAN